MQASLCVTAGWQCACTDGALVQARCTAAQALDSAWIRGHGVYSQVPLDIGVVTRMSNYASYNKVKHSILLQIAERCNNRELQNLQRQFAAMDADGDGLLDLREVTAALRAVRTGAEGKPVYTDDQIRAVRYRCGVPRPSMRRAWWGAQQRCVRYSVARRCCAACR